MTRFASFEKLVVRREIGYVCDESAMVNLTTQGTYDGAMFKLITKCETSMLILSGHHSVDQFTVDVVVRDSPNKGQGASKGRSRVLPSVADLDRIETLADAWQKCEAEGLHGLQVVALIDKSCMPDNGCQEKYTLAQFVNSIIHGIEAYFMFQKPNPFFVLNAANLWQAFEELRMESCYLIMAWKMKEDPRKEALSRISLTQLSSATPTIKNNRREQSAITQKSVAVDNVAQKRKSLPAKAQASEPVGVVKRGRRSVAPPVQQEHEDVSTDEDNEITFKTQPPQVIMPQDMSPKKVEAVVTETAAKQQLEAAIGNITLGFERSQPKTPGRKSSARKSLMPEWPVDQKEDVLNFFDNLNPNQTEQTCIALTCKFASMKYDRELPSKLLYQWVQKKGREVQKTVHSYDLPKQEQNDTMVNFFKSLDPDLSETSRVAFTCKFIQTQFGITVNSKQLYSMLNDKGKKTTRRR
ncbi:uncharacterized protein LOC121868030 isoform X2 [Homarus americanus]|uniref:Uncharacterized protein n=1 Tax=Homarus americanus TaxID=6706 RepID=A0A8J5MX82_HOMAM|nr:uncharacterized protein LOC121868030 isoform X2 [Homarus americanus]KAG7167855.1 hypothetical protein Hamer_G010260 [Homarus americanus]